MASDVVVPQMGESVLEGTILEWKVKPGEKVAKNQPLVELMTDKVNVEIPAEVAGTFLEAFAEVGEVVAVGATIGAIDDGSGPAKKPTEKKPDAAPAPKEAPKAEAPAPAPEPKPKPEPAPAAATTQGTAPKGKGKMSPKVRMLVREYDLDPGTITPTGKNGLVTVEDVMRAVDERSSLQGFTGGPIPYPELPAKLDDPVYAPMPSGQPAQPKKEIKIPIFEPLPEQARVTRMPLEGVRKRIADHMVMSKRTSPHVTTFQDIDFTELVNYRNSIKKDFRETYGANITFMSFIIKAACIALRDYPTINASLTDDEIILKNYINVGMAVARDEGLIVPVIKNADKKSVVELAVEIASLGERARTNQLTPDDISDGTFSVTNAGVFGSFISTPIISQPQVAILAVHAIQKRPWVVNDEIVIRQVMTMGMSFDHRLIDGHTAVQCLAMIRQLLSDPKQLMLHMR